MFAPARVNWLSLPTECGSVTGISPVVARRRLSADLSARGIQLTIHAARRLSVVQSEAASLRRLELAGEPADRVRLHRIHDDRDLFGPLAGRALERALFEAMCARRDARQRHPVLAYRTHRPIGARCDHPCSPRARIIRPPEPESATFVSGAFPVARNRCRCFVRLRANAWPAWPRPQAPQSPKAGLRSSCIAGSPVSGEFFLQHLTCLNPGNGRVMHHVAIAGGDLHVRRRNDSAFARRPR